MIWQSPFFWMTLLIIALLFVLGGALSMTGIAGF